MTYPAFKHVIYLVDELNMCCVLIHIQQYACSRVEQSMRQAEYTFIEFCMQFYFWKRHFYSFQLAERRIRFIAFAYAYTRTHSHQYGYMTNWSNYLFCSFVFFFWLVFQTFISLGHDIQTLAFS